MNNEPHIEAQDDNIEQEVLDIEEVEPIEPIEEVSYPAPIYKKLFSEGKVLSSEEFISAYKAVPVPLGILDETISFQVINDELKNTFDRFLMPSKASFFQTFEKFLKKGQAQEIYSSLTSKETSYTWKGNFTLESHDSISIMASIDILPYYIKKEDKEEGEKPYAWVFLLDDITQERNIFVNSLFSSLLQASKLKDNDTGKHVERVSLYSECLAKRMYKDSRWPEVTLDFVDSIGSLAAMHDVGKIGTPDDILNKKGPLSEFEWTIMKEHTINGAFILSSHPNPLAKQIAQSHHEWWNGTGYPYKLQGEMIPLAARLVAISDVYDALRMRRSYKDPCDHSVAESLIIVDRGKHFDPKLVDIFKELSPTFEKIFDDRKDNSEANRSDQYFNN